ncbi:ATP phosphoribosyltransferase regulatory subunit [Stappia sp. ES.058]|uniref:ATP phosphoribosyltransferase regulatory subunit n=1 Tax=Stappia sp. ES.058 TaxID=1881061 RepID=UPI00087C6101|nr:ATP phosphoribosyltransferase regulatory subunit [Stappia sp. ES.058]SDT91208.1 ATP phosphoribosyltransferase regulatory subunit [Stappia sp. ES.058]
MTLPDPYAKLRGLFQDNGFPAMEPEILQPSRLFLDLIGEDIRGRMYLTGDRAGEELCLRPDYTLPVCRAHLDGGAAETPARYSYCGKVFRQRQDGAGEFMQAGVECLGRADLEAADADTLALALSALETLGVSDTRIHIGDEALFRAVLSGLNLPAVWERRLGDLFGERDRLDAAIAAMRGAGIEAERGDTSAAELARALDGLAPDTAQAAVAELLRLTGLKPIAGRSAGDIAERLLEQAALARHDPQTDRAADVLTRYLAIAGDPRASVETIATFAEDAGLDLTDALSSFSARLDAIAAHGISDRSLTFAADFGRRLDYYTGFVFEIHSAARETAGQIVGGGRYDKLLALLGATAHIPATGFSIWLDRI